MAASKIDERLAAIEANLAELTKMISVVAQAPAVRRFVIEQQKLASVKAQVAYAEQFAAASPADKLAALAAMPEDRRRTFVGQLGVTNLAELAAALDEDQRVTLARFVDEQTRTAIAAAISELGVVAVQAVGNQTYGFGGDAESDDPALRPCQVRYDEASFWLVLDWDRRVELDETGRLAEAIDRGQIRVQPAPARCAAGVRAAAISGHRLALVGDGFQLVPARLVSGPPGQRARVVPLRELAEQPESRPAPEPAYDHTAGVRAAQEFQRRQREREDERQAAVIARAIKQAIRKDGHVE